MEQRSDFSKAVRDIVSRGRILLVVERYKQGKQFLGRAAELAGVPLGQMMTILAEYGVESRMRRIICKASRVSARCGETELSGLHSGTLAAMHSGVACCAQRDQILLCIGSRMAAELPVVHLKIRHRATGLTPPAVATQDLLAQTFVRQGVQPRGSGFGANHSQDAFSRRFSRKACCCSPGKNL